MVHINKGLCIGCGNCVKDCLAGNIIVKDQKAQILGNCILCGHCVAICPSGAVTIPEYDMTDVEDVSSASHLDPKELLHSIKFRRSIRDYQDRPVEQLKLETILQAGRYTATAKNNQNCCFIFIQKELSTLKHLVWDYIDRVTNQEAASLPPNLMPYVDFNRRRKENPADDFLFRNAPVVLFITSDWPLDAGLAAQNIENMTIALGLGALYNGYLCRICDTNEELKNWLGIKDQTIKACLLLGYPNRSYHRSAPRKPANVIWK